MENIRTNHKRNLKIGREVYSRKDMTNTIESVGETLEKLATLKIHMRTTCRI
jgi:hypothetical protein